MLGLQWDCKWAGLVLGLPTITLPQCTNTVWIQLDQFFKLNILDSELLDEEGEHALSIRYQN